jgi:hypothetical protein
MQIKKYIDERDLKLIEFIPTPQENLIILLLSEKMKIMHSITTSLQGNLNMSEVRHIFDDFIEIFLASTGYLSKSANIVHSPIFENAFVKILLGKHADLNENEKSILIGFNKSIQITTLIRE